MTIIKILATLLIPVVIVAAFVMPPPLAAMSQGSAASRIFFFHVPIAQVSFLSFVVAAIYAVLYLRKRESSYDTISTTAAELGLIFSVVAMITGAMWAKQAWGAYWNWDPRQTSLFILVLFYGAFFALRQAVTIPETRRRLSAVYLIFGGAISPLLFYVLPRMQAGLHDAANETIPKSNMSPTVSLFFITSIVGFLCLYLWMLKLGVAVGRMDEESV